jgi:quercetin dioxygenase-like cupin family protein
LKQQTILNKITGQQLTFIRCEKDLLEMESSWSPGKEPPAHYHQYQEEEFRIIKGRLSIRINGQVREYVTGEIIKIPKGTVHAMWNNSGTETVASWKVVPAMETEEVLRTFFGLANDGKTNKDGVPGILQVSLTASKYSREIRLAKPPYGLLKLFFIILSPIALLTGHKATQLKYIS